MIDNQENEVELQAGETVLFPATTLDVRIVPNGNVKLLETYI